MTLEREARILIVDDQREVARVLRTSLELSSRSFIVVDVPSGEEALLELGRVEFDVIVVDYRLPGMSGIELMQRVRKVQPDIKAILISGHSLSEVQHEIAALNILQIFEKPINTSAFTAAVRYAVYGEEAPEQAPAAGARGARPAWDETLAARYLSTMLTDLGAQGIALIDGEGRVLMEQGDAEAVPGFGDLALLLTRSFAATAGISAHLGDQPSTAIHYYGGSWYDIYALSAGLRHLVAVIFPGGSQKQMGPVLRYGKPAARKLGEVLDAEGSVVGETAPGSGETAAAPASTSQGIPASPDYEQESRASPQEAGSELAGSYAESNAPDFDLDFDELPDLDNENLGDLDRFWAEAASTETKISDDALSLDEAIELGLLPKDADAEE